MPKQDEPLPARPDEIEEISTEFIVQDEPAAPVAHDDPFVAASRALVVEAAPRPARPAAPEPRPARADVPRERPVAPVSEPSPEPAPGPTAAAEPTPRRQQSFPLLIALVFLLVGGGSGFFAGVLWERQGGAARAAAAHPMPPPAAPPGADADEPSATAPKPAKGAKPPARKATATAKAPPTARATAAKGRLKLTAPPEAEVYLDGRRIGRGSMQVDVAAGAHRIEVRLGKAKVAERFAVEPNETWTYDVTPAK